jgi:hypothetical protein
MNHNLMDSLPEPKRRPIYIVSWEDYYGKKYERYKTVDVTKAESYAMHLDTLHDEMSIDKKYIHIRDWEKLRDKERDKEREAGE